MGVNGREWVRLGMSCMGVHINKTRRGKNGCAGHDSVAMAGEISPDIMFLRYQAKGSRMGADGCRWVLMGAVGCEGTGGTKN